MGRRGASAFFSAFVILLLAAVSVIAVFMIIQDKGLVQMSVGQMILDPKEIGIVEDGEVLEYGTFSGIEEGVLRKLLSGFIDEYSKIEKIEKFYFVSGNVEKITVMKYEMSPEDGIPKLRLAQGDIILRVHTEEEKISEKVVQIEGYEDTTYLRPNEKFFFVIIKTAEGEEKFY